MTMLQKMPDSEPGDLAKVGELIRDIQVALLTTADPNGGFHTRPVQTLRVEAGGTLWFFTDWSSGKIDELHRDERVSLGYADPSKNIYEDKRLALLRVVIERAEYWIAPGRMSYLVAAVTAAVTGTPAGVVGENRKIG